MSDEKRFEVSLGMTIHAKNEDEAMVKAEALCGYLLEDYGLMDAFVESVTDPDEEAVDG